ncbi:pathogenesis-related protein [Herbaspirillum rubrisubalbicans M1]|uniref:UvrD-helicase domain-containing protein n=1 Tax=Herbaspirillum rubrisubalbicans TaxID=80842 RepID=UPI000739FD6B|nr:UvrD-helicase domain-containing protein [Herbaspirillum rubrisubalbicans]ALU91504.1 pathogenesis-related protein [Herbaspirillum rubrisubalbicans M1]
MSGLPDVGGNDRDAHVVEDICRYVTANPAQSFFLFAGAGSGKTRTLVEVLRRVTGVVEHEAGKQYAERLRARGQAVRVITYTKNATAVVTGRLGENVLTEVSTIHSFCWDLIQGFDADIKEALLARIDKKLDELKRAARAKARGESDTDRRKYAELEDDATKVRATDSFIYHPDRRTFGAGALTHSQVIDSAAWLLNERPTLRRIVADRHPLILIDESQDTMRAMLDSLFGLAASFPGMVTLGLLGDHRQRIYADGHDDLPSHIPRNWERPALQMNHRSQKRIVDLINDIWEADLEGRTQPKTGVRQTPRTEKEGGAVRMFIGSAHLSTEEKMASEGRCAEAMKAQTGIDAWGGDVKKYTTLALEHKLAAIRGGFLNAYVAVHLLDPDASAPSSSGDRSGPGMLRPLLGAISELAECVNPDASINEFAAMNVLRRDGLFAKLPDDSIKRGKVVADIQHTLNQFAQTVVHPDATVDSVVGPLLDLELFDVDGRFYKAYRDETPAPPPPAVLSQEDVEDRRKRGWEALFRTPWQEIPKYRAYLRGEMELATHQVVKGSEFEHVMVVMDDTDAGGFLFSYDKVFGSQELSKSDLKNIEEGRETSIDRTLRLLYVTCSRAEESLALVLWAANPGAAMGAVQATGWFREGEVQEVK